MFGDGIEAKDILWQRFGNDLFATIESASNSKEGLILSGWFVSEVHRVDEFQLADGSLADGYRVLG